MSEPDAFASSETRRVLRQSLVWDNHACLPQSLSAGCLDGLQRYLDAGVTCVHVNIGDADLPLEMQLRLAQSYRAYLERHPQYLMVSRIEDIHAAKSSGQLAVCFDVEGLYALGNDLSVLGRYRDIGVRWILLAYNRRNTVGGGCHDVEDHGLTPFGFQVVAELDRLGIVKDCSHTGYRTSRDVLEASLVPVNFSHSNPRALTDHPRNIPDDLIRECARTGGVVGINGIGIFLGSNDVSTENMVRHIDYVANLVGPQHVGIGLDYVTDADSGGLDVSHSPDFWPPGFGYEPGVRLIEPERIPWIADALLVKGYSELDVNGILGSNFLRVARQVWK